jgi:hypothetical protein
MRLWVTKQGNVFRFQGKPTGNPRLIQLAKVLRIRMTVRADCHLTGAGCGAGICLKSIGEL